MFRTPIIDLLTIFIPLWLLGLINLLIFFQDENLGDRLANIAAVLIAFSALVPTIRSQIPPAPQVTLVQIMIYLQIGTALLALVQSYLVYSAQTSSQSSMGDQSSSLSQLSSSSSSSQSSSPLYSSWQTDGLFLAAIIINSCTFIVVIGLFVIFFCHWRKSYLNIDSEVDEDAFKEVTRKMWSGGKADIVFERYREDNEDLLKFKFLDQQMEVQQ